MALKQFTYYNGEYIYSCNGCGPIETGEFIKVELDGTNPDWPKFFLGTISHIENSSTGPTYTITYDDSDFSDPEGVPYCPPNPCNVNLVCATCCDTLSAEDLLDILTNSPAFCQAVIKCIDDDLNDVIDNILTINADQVNGLCEAIYACISDGEGEINDDLTIDSSQVRNLCSAVIGCITDPDGSLIDTITVDTDQINNFRDGIIDALDLNNDNRIDPTVLPEARDLDDFCPSVLECLDTSSDGYLDALYVSAQNQIPDFCDELIRCVDTNDDNVVDWGLLMPVSLIQNFCPEVINCVEQEDNIFCVNAGDTEFSPDDAYGQACVGWGDTLHFWSSNDSINITVTEGSAIVDLTIDQLDCQDVIACVENEPFDCSNLPIIS